MTTAPASKDVWRRAEWYVIHAKSRRESFAVANVQALGLEVFYPRIRQERFVSGLPQSQIKPLFPGYFFARFCSAASLGTVRCARGVLQVISSGRIPIPVEERVIDEIQARLDDDGCLCHRPYQYQPGDAVAIADGPFAGLVGRVEREWEGGRRIAILLEAIHQARVLVDRHWVSLSDAAS